jgi:hypothetical protein
VCGKRHRSLLHLCVSQQNKDKGSSVSTDKPTKPQATSTPEASSYCSFKGKPRNHILLATAVVLVRNKHGQYFPVRTMLNSGSQINIISENRVQRLVMS